MYLRQTRPVRRGPPKISRAGYQVFTGLAKKTKYVDPNLAGDWPSIAGGDIAALCRPGKMTGKPGDKSLELIAPSGAAAAELQAQTDMLLKRLNGYFGPRVISRVTIRQAAPASTPTPNASENDGLEGALSSFRAAISRRNRPK